MTCAALAASAGLTTSRPAAFRFRNALTALRQADNHVETRIAQVQRMRMALAAVADNGDLLTPQGVDVSVFFVKSVVA